MRPGRLNYLVKVFGGATTKPRFWGLGGLPGLIFIDLEAWEIRMRQLLSSTFSGSSVAQLENLGSESWEACHVCISLIVRLGRLRGFSYLFGTFWYLFGPNIKPRF